MNIAKKKVWKQMPHKMIKREVEDLERGLIIVLSQTLFLSPQRHAQSWDQQTYI
jgi:hypothetical protein